MKSFFCKLEELAEIGGTKRAVAFLILGGLSLILSILNEKLNFAPLPFDFAWISIVLCGYPIILEAVVGLATRFDIRAGVLVSMALIASIVIGEYFAAGEIVFIMQLGELLEELTVERARAGIEKLVKMLPQTARIVLPDGEKTVPAGEVEVGDTVRVLPGETIPVDGVIVSGQTSVNQAVMTGESMPVDKGAGDQVSSGTVNQFGAFDMKAEKVGEESSIQRMIRLVQSADAGKAKIVTTADKWATWIVVAALAAALLTYIFSGEIIRSVTVLVVFCPCALVLATPTAIMAAIGNAAKHSFLVREGDALERLSGVDRITFDKTGTLTSGIPRVVSVKSASNYSEDEIFALVAAAEKLSEHPLGKAVAASFSGKTADVKDFRMIPGRGVSAEVGGKRVTAGNRIFLEENGIDVAESGELKAAQENGGTLIFAAVDGVFAGFLVLSDSIREDAKTMVEKIYSLGIDPMLLTGDNENSARSVTGEVGIKEFSANCLPEDKLNKIGELQGDGGKVCMVGDGINDAPALKKAHVGIAMGGVGSDIAMEAADMVLINDDIKALPHLLALSKRMMKTIKLNLSFSMFLNFAAIFLAIYGAIGPVAGALVHNAGSFLVIVNSALLLKWKLD